MHTQTQPFRYYLPVILAKFKKFANTLHRRVLSDTASGTEFGKTSVEEHFGNIYQNCKCTDLCTHQFYF